MLNTDTSIPFYPDTNGLPLQKGQLFFGLPGQNPVTSPVIVYWDQAGTQPAAQPITTINGLPSRNGAPARLWVGGDYSRLVRDSLGRQILYEQSVSPVSGAGGAASVGFTQTATGAGARNVQDKLQERYFSVKDFLCDDGQFVKGDGVHDDTTGIQKAINAACSALSVFTRIVRFPRGDYLITAQLAWPDGVVWEGDYGRAAASAGNNAQPTAIIWGGAAGVIPIVASTTVGLNAFGYMMRNLRLLATGANRPANWVQHLNRCDSGTGFENVGFHFSTGPAVRFEKGGINVYIRGGRLDQCAGFYWNIQGQDNVSITDMTQDHGAQTVGEQAQFFIADHTTSPAGAKLYNTFKNINIEGNANLAAGTAYFEFRPRVDASGYPFAFRGTFQNVLVKPAGGVTEYTGIKVSPSADRVAFTLINTKLTWTGIPSAPMYDTTKDNQPFTVLAPHGTLDSASPAIEGNVIDLRGEANIRRLLQFGKPAIATLYADVADTFWNTNPSTLLAGQWVFNPTDVNTNPRKVKEVTVAGTLGTLAGVTGTGTIGTNLLTVNDASNLRMGHWITVVGDANPHKIALLDYTTGILQLANNLGATVAGAAVSFAPPTYRDHRLMQTLEGSVVWDPPSIVSAGTQASTTIIVPGVVVGDQVIGVSASISLSGLHLWGEVTAADTVTVFLSNLTGAAVDRPSMTVFATVLKRA